SSDLASLGCERLDFVAFPIDGHAEPIGSFEFFNLDMTRGVIFIAGDADVFLAHGNSPLGSIRSMPAGYGSVRSVSRGRGPRFGFRLWRRLGVLWMRGAIAGSDRKSVG